jgi:methyltransferase (TIGR00027 family)
MKTNIASRTAQYMALFRALETTRPPDRRLFTDPYARSFLDGSHKFFTQLSVVPFIRSIVYRIIRKRIPGALSSGLARTKYIDELLQQAVINGVKQVIILGAGFDTRGLRLDFLRDLPVIEIDHPATSKVKQERVKKCLGKLPGNIRYLTIDFNQQKLEDLATGNNIDYTVPTVFVWEGVSNYLTPAAVAATFSFVRLFAAGSQVIFTYVDEKILVQPGEFFGGQKLLNDLEGLEEKWTFGMMPADVRRYLNTFGLELLEDFSAVDYRKNYLPERTEKGYEFYRVAFAVKK